MTTAGKQQWYLETLHRNQLSENLFCPQNVAFLQQGRRDHNKKKKWKQDFVLKCCVEYIYNFTILVGC